MAGGNLRVDELAPAVLAYVGDAVFELFVRERLVRGTPGATVRALHRRTTASVCAPAQARMARIVAAGILTEEETGILRRGRNAHCGRVPPGAAAVDYRLATGFESLIGYLYLSGRAERLAFLLEQALGPAAEEDGE